MDLHELRIYARVARLASFTQAAQQLGLTKSRVSAAVQRLEVQLGTRLLQRTTRQVRLTSDGAQFLARCEELLVDAEQLQAMFQPAASGLHGRLRIDLPNALARDLLIPRLPEFLAAHPLLEIGISTSDHHVDLVHEGFDCVLRIGPLATTELIARPLGEMAMCNLASPAYLAAHGTPVTPGCLLGHNCLQFNYGEHRGRWRLMRGGETEDLHVRGTLLANNAEVLRQAAVAGTGIALLADWLVHGDLRRGALVRLLPDYRANPASMDVALVALYQPSRRGSRNVTAFLDLLDDHLARHAGVAGAYAGG